MLTPAPGPPTGLGHGEAMGALFCHQLQRRFYRDALAMTEVDEEFALPAAHIRSTILRSADGLKIELIQPAA